MGRELVAVPAAPGADFVDALGAAWDAGRAVLPIDPRLPPGAVARVIAAMRPGAVAGGLPEPQTAGVPVAPEVALVVPTSGTTAAPKGVELTHDALAAAARATIARLGLMSDDRWLCCLPLAHVAGLGIVVRSMVTGSAPVIHDRFDPDAIAGEHDANLIALVPTMLARLLDGGVDLARFKVVLVGGDRIPPDLVARGRDRGARVVTTYGMTETCGGVVYDRRPLDGVEVTVADRGEIVIRGPMVMRGYRLRDDLTRAALRGGGLHTGDLGEFDDDGRLRVVGRVDDMIITGGEKVLPDEIEARLRAHPGVADVAVVGMPDAEWGQRIVAAVIAAPDARPPTIDEVRALLADRVPSYAVPKDVVVLDDLPVLPSGKTARRLVVKRLARR